MGGFQAELLHLQAFPVDQSMNAIGNGQGFCGAGVEHYNRIAAPLDLDVADYFQPTTEAQLRPRQTLADCAPVKEPAASLKSGVIRTR
jgi:hypothetical protein